ncbi:hypothetical protein BJY01DRAFT_174105 [Aspergillus pseudoustus]|uniref:Uncharacterized protein n=1 Tax=Aspergillus pseudoustus TaxID=1810923 RepID=A0ABR4K2W4_9EURO
MMERQRVMERREGKKRREKSNGGERRSRKIWQHSCTDATTWSPPPIPPTGAATHRADRRGKAAKPPAMRRQNIEWVDCQLVYPVCAAGQLLSNLSGFIHRAKQESHDIWDSYSCRTGQWAHCVIIKPGTHFPREPSRECFASRSESIGLFYLGYWHGISDTAIPPLVLHSRSLTDGEATKRGRPSIDDAMELCNRGATPAFPLWDRIGSGAGVTILLCPSSEPPGILGASSGMVALLPPSPRARNSHRYLDRSSRARSQFYIGGDFAAYIWGVDEWKGIILVR